MKIIILLKLLWARYKGNVVFINYYSSHKNVGDVLAQDLVLHYSGKLAVKPPYVRFFEHYLIIGSIIEHANKNSIVLGAGTNSEDKIKNISEVNEVKALRGHITRGLLSERIGHKFDVPLGDFALLYPRIYNPKLTKEYRFGVILHYVDFSQEIVDMIEKNGGLIISVDREPRDFIRMMLRCERIISSSMHGVILSDAYNIPNKRIIISDKITGADLKFSDYYSTTEMPDKKGHFIFNKKEFSCYEKAIEDCSVSRYTYNLDLLEKFLKEI